jgi:hypothetical protein
VEVKSNVAAQWPQAQHTSAQLAPLRRSFGATMQMGGIPPTEQIPLFVAGYTGWATMETIETHLAQNPNVAGILVIDSGLFASSAQFGGLRGTGAVGTLGADRCFAFYYKWFAGGLHKSAKLCNLDYNKH